MKHRIFLLWALLVALTPSLKAANANEPSRPKLVVGIVVDQMRWDYLYRYYDLYCEGGFKRLLNHGFSCENTMINYIPTYTAVGHASLYTGSVPAIHGIAANSFINEMTGEKMYCTGDESVTSIGSTSEAGKQSPKNLLATTITDELKLATNFQSKVVGVALKDRGAILPAGHCADAAYWFDESNGAFISSSYYMDALPKWVEKFNKKDLAAKYLKQNWTLLKGKKDYVQATEDNTPYEKSISAGDPTLPLKTAELFKEKGYGIIRTVPAGNTLTLDLAKEAIENESLGILSKKDDEGKCDFLCVSLSATDYVGHNFAVNSVEIEDTYLRLDEDLADFLSYLDKYVGQDNYLLFLSADHAGAHNVLFMQDHGLPAGGWEWGTATNELNAAVVAKYGVDGIVRSTSNYQIHVDKALARNNRIDLNDLKELLIETVEAMDGVQCAFDMENVGNAAVPQIIKERAINGYNRQRSGIIQIIMEPGWYSVTTKTDLRGTTHGSWNPYDSHIPLLFYGWRIPQGGTNAEVYITDISATLAALLHIQMPSGCVGTPILPALGE